MKHLKRFNESKEDEKLDILENFAYITDKLGKKAFFPKNGCPLKKINISDDIVLIIIDSQWYLENWDNNPTMNDDCDIKTRELFFDEFESLIKKNESKTTIVAMHHPLFRIRENGITS